MLAHFRFPKISLLLMVALVAGLAAPLASPVTAQDDVTLTVWHQFAGGEGGEQWEQAKAAFEEAYPNIRIEDTVYAFEDMQTAMTIAMAGGEGPDVAFYDASSAFLGALVEAEFVQDLTPLFEERGWGESMFDWAQERTSYDGKNYGVGGYIEIVGIFYNADLLAELGLEPPSDWDSVIATAEAALEADILPFAEGALEPWPPSHFCGVLVHSMVPMKTIAAAELLEGDGSWTDPQMVAAANECQNFVESGYYPGDIVGVSHLDALNDFIAGRALMRVDGTWNIGNISESEYEMGFVRFPEKDADAVPPQAEGGLSSTWIVNANTDKMDAVADFLDFMVFSDESNEIFLSRGWLPSVTFDYDTAAVDIPLLTQAVAAIDTVSTEGNGLGYWIGYMSDPSVSEVMASGWQLLLAGEIDAEEFAELVSAAQEEARQARN